VGLGSFTETVSLQVNLLLPVQSLGQGRRGLNEGLSDGPWVGAKKGGIKGESLSGAKGQSLWLWPTLMGFHAPCTC
jgi:hypothetical protein